MSDHPAPSRRLDLGEGAYARRLAEILRVDHAGELGAVHIYRGQTAVFSRARGGERMAADMAEHEAGEQVHLSAFDGILTREGVRPTVSAPLWRAPGVAQAGAEGSREAPGYALLSAVVTAGCRAAIKVSEKL